MKENFQKIEIELSKRKLTFALVVSIFMTALSLWELSNPSKFVNFIFVSKEVIFVAALFGVLIFSLFSYFIAKKLLDKKMGLTILQDGIIDNSSATAIGKIDWNDITEIKTRKVATTKFLMLETDKPEKYLQLAKNKFAKKNMEANNKWYGSPLAITSTGLKINFENLERLLRTEFDSYNAKKNVV